MAAMPPSGPVTVALVGAPGLVGHLAVYWLVKEAAIMGSSSLGKLRLEQARQLVPGPRPPSLVRSQAWAPAVLG